MMTMTKTSAALRKTAGREKILSLLSEKKAWTVAELRKKIRGVEPSTIYRNINKLIENGTVIETETIGREARFELSGRGHHEHQVCPKCGAAECVPCPLKKTVGEHILEIKKACVYCK